MKRRIFAIISLILVLIMCVGTSVMLIACDEHEHTYGADGKCTECGEAKPSHEHTYGADGKCTECGEIKPTDYKATAELWVSEIENIKNAVNMKSLTVAGMPGYPQQTVTHEFDGDKISMLRYIGDTFDEHAVLVKTGENAYELYTKEDEEVVYTKTIPTEGVLYDYLKVRDEFAGFAAAAKDNFASAVFDEATNTYTLNLDTAVIAGSNASEVVYTIAFKDGAMTSLNLKFKTGQWDYSIDFKFGGVTVTIPQV